MPAQEIWRAQMEAVRTGDWDTMSGYFATDCTWTLMPPGTTFHGPDEITTFMRSGFDAAAKREEADVRNEFATDEWGVFEYTSRGIIDARRAAQFAQKIKGTGQVADDLAEHLEGRGFEIPVCFIYHVNPDGLIDQVNEYAAMPTFPAA
jgi:hypothetical protein